MNGNPGVLSWLLLIASAFFFACNESPDSACGDQRCASRSAQTAESATYRIGDIEVDKWAGFDVAVDEASGLIHFVGRGLNNNKLQMHHLVSADGAKTWSPPVLIDAGHQMDLALDSKGGLHVVYGNMAANRARYPSNVKHRLYENGAWGAAHLIATHVTDKVNLQEMRIAVDGADNAHIIYHDAGPQKFYPGTETDNWEDDRIVYVMRARNGTWSEPERWKGNLSNEGGLGGDMFVDANGAVHFVLLTGSSNTWKLSLERMTVSPSGKRSDRVDHARFPVGNGMHERFGGQLASDGRLYLGGISSKPSGLAVWRFEVDPAKPPTRLFSEGIGTRAGTDLLLDPSGNGDIWVAVGNWRIATGQDDHQRGFYYHYDAATNNWSQKTELSPSDAANVETFWDTTPKFRTFGGQVQLYYSEKLPGEKARFYVRVFGQPTPPTDAPAAHDASPPPNKDSGPSPADEGAPADLPEDRPDATPAADSRATSRVCIGGCRYLNDAHTPTPFILLLLGLCLFRRKRLRK